MTKFSLKLTCLAFALASSYSLSSYAFGQDEFQSFKINKEVKVPTASKAATEAWKDQRFGMFIHWGPISQKGLALSHSRISPSHSGGKPYKTPGKTGISAAEYDKQYKTFNPVNFDADAMMKMAKDAGIAYTVFTAKHHAGFSMFDSKVTDYDMMSTPYNKDITREIADASRKQGIDFGFYYSPRDWGHPDADSVNNHPRYIKWYKKQMNELLDNYGDIHEIWFDGMGPGDWGNTSEEIMTLIRQKQPDALVNDRGGVGADFYTPEHYTGYFNTEQPWEACHTTTSQWGFNPKTKAKKLSQLMEILLYTWGGDGNVLLNIGPMGDGSINPKEKKRFEQLAAWWQVHGEKSIRGSRGGPYIPGPWGVATNKGNSVFLHIFRFGEDQLAFPALDGLKLKGSSLLNGKSVTVTEKDGLYLVDVPKNSREDIATTVELTFDKSTRGLTPIQRVKSLTALAKVTASHSENIDYLYDQNAETQWHGQLDKKRKEKAFVFTAEFEQPQIIGSMAVQRGSEWTAKHQAKIEIRDSKGKWQDISKEVQGMRNGKVRFRFTSMVFLKQPVQTDAIRMTISKASQFTIAEWELYPPVK